MYQTNPPEMNSIFFENDYLFFSVAACQVSENVLYHLVQTFVTEQAPYPDTATLWFSYSRHRFDFRPAGNACSLWQGHADYDLIL